jgi:hypothetical protein
MAKSYSQVLLPNQTNRPLLITSPEADPEA